ncbi:MAG: hypothetical protein JWO53_585 [Chlamydiia bacterium]|nr:hypothetical protein [Chlamydiia bacterium]
MITFYKNIDSITNSITNNTYLFTIYTLTSPLAGVVRVIAHIARSIFYDLWMYSYRGKELYNKQLIRNFKQILLGLGELAFLVSPCAILYFSKIQKKAPLDPISQKLLSFDNSHINEQIHGVYITTNETNLAATRQLLRAHPRPNDEKPTIHIGCATWHNFDIMCERKSNYGLVIDFNPKNAKFIKKTVNLVNASASRDLFKKNIVAYLHSLKGKARDLFFHEDQKGLPTDRIEEELLREGSWLQTEENYLFIKNIVSKGRLAAFTEDITNFENFSNLRNFLDEHTLVIDTLYLSNICNFMDTERKKSAFVKSIKHMLTDNTILINCPMLRQSTTRDVILLYQKSILGRELLINSYDTCRLFEEVI